MIIPMYIISVFSGTNLSIYGGNIASPNNFKTKDSDKAPIKTSLTLQFWIIIYNCFYIRHKLFSPICISLFVEVHKHCDYSNPKSKNIYVAILSWMINSAQWDVRMTKKIKLSELGSLLGGDIQALEGVKIEGDVEIDLGKWNESPDGLCSGSRDCPDSSPFDEYFKNFSYPLTRCSGTTGAAPKRLSKLIESKFSVVRSRNGKLLSRKSYWGHIIGRREPKEYHNTWRRECAALLF